MGSKQIDVVCPCCNTRLTVDVLTRKIMRHAAPAQIDETGKAVLDMGRWDSAKDRVAGRRETSADKFDSALGQEKTRSGDLDDLFDKAKRKVQERKQQLEDDE